MESTKLITSGGRWFRFSSYEIITSPDGFAKYVRPSRSAKIEYYRPFEQFPHILQEYLQMGREFALDLVVPPTEIKNDMWFRERTLRTAKRIVEFARQFGIPGILWAYQPQLDLSAGSRKDRVFIPNDPALIGTAFESPIGLQDSKRFLEWFLVDRFKIEAALHFNPTFLRAYAEPIDGVFVSAIRLFNLAMEWERFRTLGAAGSDQWRSQKGKSIPGLTWKDRLRGDSAINAGLTIRFDNGHPHLDHTFDSLISALGIMFVLNAAGPATDQLRLCALAECGQPFIARYDRSRYCNDSHANRDRQRSFVQKQKDRQKGKPNGRQRPKKKK